MSVEDWDPATKELVEWFLSLDELPETPLTLAPGRTVVNAEKFFKAMREDIELGPDSPYARRGSLKLELMNLRNAMEQL